MKKYETPEIIWNTFEFCDEIAIEVNPDQSTSDVFVKERGDDSSDPDGPEDSDEWKNGLW